MIVEECGRFRSIRTPTAEANLLSEEFARLSVEEQAAVLRAINDPLVASELMADQYDTTPVDPARWLYHAEHGKELCRDMYSKLRDEFVDFQTGAYFEFFLTGSTGFGKTFLTAVCMAYDLYRLLCLRSPQRSYGMADGSQLLLFAYSTTISQAGTGFGTEFLATLEKIPFFARMKRPKGSGFQAKFPKSLVFMTATEAANKALGTNAIGGLVDEGDFHGKSAKTDADGQAMDRGESVYLMAIRRIKNRFMRKGWTPAHFYVLSSKTTRRSFMVRQIRAKTHNDRVKVIDYAAYDVRPATDYLPGRFPVFIGTDATPPRMLASDEVQGLPLEYQKLVTWVPQDFKDDFETDVHGALQELAGIAINPSGKFFRTPQRVLDVVDPTLHHPFTVYSWICGGAGDFRWDRLAVKRVKKVTREYHEEVWEPLVNPEAERYAHIDASSTDCPTGLAVGHISRWVAIHRRNKETLDRVEELVPVITIDFMLQIIVPPDGEIDLALVRALLVDLRRHGFRLTRVTTDSYQAAENHLRLKDAGFEPDLVSTDKTRKVYDTAKVVINEGRLVTYPYPVLQRELLDLEEDPMSGKIVKPRRSIDGSKPTKDVADAVACVVHELETRRPSQAYASVPRRGKVAGAEDAWVTGGLIPLSTYLGDDGGY